MARVDSNGTYSVAWALADMWRDDNWRTSIRLLEAYALRLATYGELAEFANHTHLQSLSGDAWTLHMVRDRIRKARKELRKRIAECEQRLADMNGAALQGERSFF